MQVQLEGNWMQGNKPTSAISTLKQKKNKQWIP